MKFWDFPQDYRWLLIEGRLSRGKVIGETNGTFGTIYTLDQGENVLPRYLIAKTPRILSTEDSASVQAKIRKFLHELNQTYIYSNHPLISRHVKVKMCWGVPFVLSVKRDLTIRDLIENEVTSSVEAASIIAQIAHALGYCARRGLTSHQDLKPDNVLLVSIATHFKIPTDYPVRFLVRICDFGLANAFSHFGTCYGSRPYMAPEQYTQGQSLAKADVFALGVILHELTGGEHPIGEITSDVWPNPLPMKGKKWTHENVWKKWARSTKTIGFKDSLAHDLKKVIQQCLLADIAESHHLYSLEHSLLSWIRLTDKAAYSNLELLFNYFDELALEGEVGGWPYYEHLLEQVNGADWS